MSFRQRTGPVEDVRFRSDVADGARARNVERVCEPEAREIGVSGQPPEYLQVGLGGLLQFMFGWTDSGTRLLNKRARYMLRAEEKKKTTLRTGLVSHWKLDEASGTRYDAHGSNHLQDNNTVTQAVGKINNAGQFTRANSEYLSCAANDALRFAATIALWVLLDTKEYQELVNAFKVGSSSNGYAVYYNDATDRFAFGAAYSNNNFTNVAANNLGSPNTGQWYFIVAWYDAATATLNIQVNDGTTNSAAHTAFVNTATQFQMGAITAPNYLNGRLDSVSIWSRVLTADERATLYNGGAGLDYPFDSDDGERRRGNETEGFPGRSKRCA